MVIPEGGGKCPVAGKAGPADGAYRHAACSRLATANSRRPINHRQSLALFTAPF